MREKVVIVNKEDLIVELTVSTTDDYVSVVSNEYGLYSLSEDERAGIIEDFIAEVFDVNMFFENRDMSVNDFIEKYQSNIEDFIDEIVGDVEDYEYLEDDTVRYWQLIGAGQSIPSEKEFGDIAKVWRDNHLKTDDVDSRYNEVMSVLNRYKENVSQDLPF